MITYKITKDELAQAKKESVEMGSLNGSITGGKGNIAGLLSEIVISNRIDRMNRANTYDYDLIDIIDNKKYDVKAKRTNYTPRLDYECSIADWNTKQECDGYIFTRITYEYDKLWLLGYLNKKNYFSLAKFHKTGEYDSSNNFTFKANCWNVKIKELLNLNNKKVVQQQLKW